MCVRCIFVFLKSDNSVSSEFFRVRFRIVRRYIATFISSTSVYISQAEIGNRQRCMPLALFEFAVLQHSCIEKGKRRSK
jgi:hypothetical protein